MNKSQTYRTFKLVRDETTGQAIKIVKRLPVLRDHMSGLTITATITDKIVGMFKGPGKKFNKVGPLLCLVDETTNVPATIHAATNTLSRNAANCVFDDCSDDSRNCAAGLPIPDHYAWVLIPADIVKSLVSLGTK